MRNLILAAAAAITLSACVNGASNPARNDPNVTFLQPCYNPENCYGFPPVQPVTTRPWF